MGRWGEGVRSGCRICRSRLGSRCRSRGFDLGAGGKGVSSGYWGIGARGEWVGSVVKSVCRDRRGRALVGTWARSRQEGSSGTRRRRIGHGEIHIVLGSTVSDRAAAAVEVGVLTCTGAAHATLSMATDVNVGNARRVRVARALLSLTRQSGARLYANEAGRDGPRTAQLEPVPE